MSTRFYAGQQDYIVQLNLMDDVWSAGVPAKVNRSGDTFTGSVYVTGGVFSVRDGNGLQLWSPDNSQYATLSLGANGVLSVNYSTNVQGDLTVSGSGKLDVAGVPVANALRATLTHGVVDGNFKLQAFNGVASNGSADVMARFGLGFGDNPVITSGFTFLRGGGASDSAMDFWSNSAVQGKLSSSGHWLIGNGTDDGVNKLQVTGSSAFNGNLTLNSGVVGIGTAGTIQADLHVSGAGSDGTVSGTLSLSGTGGASIIKLGNRDVAGVAGPSIIYVANRTLQFGLGDSHSDKNGGNFSALMTLGGDGHLFVKFRGDFGGLVTSTGTDGGFLLCRRDNNAAAFELYSTGGEFGLYAHARATNALYISQAGAMYLYGGFHVEGGAGIEVYAGEALRIKNDGGYISFWDSANSSRKGYLQHNGEIVLNNETSNPIRLQVGGANRISAHNLGADVLGNFYASGSLNTGDAAGSRANLGAAKAADTLTSAGTLITNTADWNTYTTAGVYIVSNSSGTWGTGGTNTPPQTAYPYGSLLVTANATIVTQTYMTHSNGGMYFRMKFNSAPADWMPWARVSTDLNPILQPISAGGTGATTQAGALNNIVGFTPVQQAGGAGQVASNKLYIGWLGNNLGLQVDATNFGSVWPISVTGDAATAALSVVGNNSTNIANTRFVQRAATALRAHTNISGGGLVSVSATNEVKWSSRFIVISNGNGTDFAGDGYFDITMPASGAVITGVAGASNATVNANGIPLPIWCGLYYILPVGGVSSSVSANFRIVSYTSGIDIPANWLLVVVQNSDSGSYRFSSGITLRAGESYDAGYRSSADAPRRDGTYATGIWPINVSGNAATVTNGVYTTGNQTAAGVKTFSDGIVTTAGTGVRLKFSTDTSGYSVLQRNDSNDFYLLVTNLGDADGTWNGLRPFSFHLSSGLVSVGNGLSVTGAATFNNTVTFSGASTFNANATFTTDTHFNPGVSHYMHANSGASVGLAGSVGGLNVYGFDAGGGTVGGAVMSFHRPGLYAINFGLDTDGVVRLGGWSDGGAVYRWQIDTNGNETVRGTITAGGNGTFNGTGSLKVPAGTTAQRLVQTGAVRLNTDTSTFEGHNGAAWVSMAAVVAPGAFRNKVRNSKMEIAQRGTSFTGLSSSSAYTLDGWIWGGVGTSAVVTVSQGTGLLSTECQYSLRVQVTTADASMTAAKYANITQAIEGYLVRDLIGNAIAIRFEVTSPKSGTHYVAIRNGGTDRSYVIPYTVTTANTAQLITLALPGGLITAGTWNWTNGTGLYVSFPLMAGTNVQTTTGAWQTGNFIAASGQQNLLDTVGNVFAITGIQLEKGSASTPLEHRDIGSELATCQRYYETGLAAILAMPPAADNYCYTRVIYKQTKRASPTFATPTVLVNSNAKTPTQYSSATDSTGYYVYSVAAGGVEYQFNWTASSEL